MNGYIGCLYKLRLLKYQINYCSIFASSNYLFYAFSTLSPICAVVHCLIRLDRLIFTIFLQA